MNTTTKPRTLATKNTGSYLATLIEDGTEQYAVLVTYIGREWPSGDPSWVWLDVDTCELDEAWIVSWFEDEVRGDLDAQQLLGVGGFDIYGNAIEGVRPRAMEVR